MNPIFEIKYLIRRFTLQSASEQFLVRNREKKGPGKLGRGGGGQGHDDDDDDDDGDDDDDDGNDDDEEKDYGDDEYVNLS